MQPTITTELLEVKIRIGDQEGGQISQQAKVGQSCGRRFACISAKAAILAVPFIAAVGLVVVGRMHEDSTMVDGGLYLFLGATALEICCIPCLMDFFGAKAFCPKTLKYGVLKDTPDISSNQHWSAL